MTWKDLWNRLKSPVITIQTILVIGGAIAIAWPDLAPGWKILAGVINIVWGYVSGVNNPTNKTGW